MKQRFHIHLLSGTLLLMALWSGCKDKEDPPIPQRYENGVFILNEGNFQGGNASLDFLHQPGDSISRDIFRRSQDRPLGDVAHSMSIHDGKAWIVVNNSGKIEVLNLPQPDLHCLVQGMTSPRFILFLHPDKAYVTDLYSRSIHILNPQTCSLIGSIPTGGWTEEMLWAEGKVFVAQMGTDKVLVIDPETDVLMDSLVVGREPNSMVRDAAGRIWVLCSGGLGETHPSLASIDPVNLTSTVEITFPSISASPERLRIDPAGQRLYWVHEGRIMSLETASNPPVATEWIAGRGGSFYALEVDPADGTLYVGDALDYVRRGILYRYSPDGVLRDSFATGVIPGSFVFSP